MDPDVGHGQDDVLGERARAVDADALGIRTEMPPTGQAVAAEPAHDVALAADDQSGLEVDHVGADLDDLAHELVADHQGHGNGLGRPRVPVVDVQVGAADPRPMDADEHVVDAGLGLGDVGEPQPAFGPALHQRFHGSSTPEC